MPRSSSGDLPDHISALPDDVVTRIFSFLPFKDVVKTSALSRRWRYTWTTASPHLEFDGFWHGNHEASPSGFQSLVDSVLRQCTSSAVKKFHITNFKCSKANGPKLEHWLRIAGERRVEDLRLWPFSLRRSTAFLRSTADLPSTYVVPQFLFCSDWLVRLEVSLCCFSLGTAINWPSLKFLSMVRVKLSDDILERIFMGSPVLESLELRECWGTKNIVIGSTSLKHLLLIGSSFSNVGKIRAPHLLSLCVSGTWEGRGDQFMDISLDDVSSLVEAKLDLVFVITGWPGAKRTSCNLLKELLKKLCGVPTITIGGSCLKILSHLKLEAVPSPLSKCQNLILHASVGPRDLAGIAYMLRSSQCLEKLVIHLPRSELKLDEELEGFLNFESKLLCLRKGNFECLAKHLKRVEIIGIGAISFRSQHLLPLIEFLLGDALVLEKLVIEAKLATPGVLSELRENVLSFRKASQNAKVIFV